MTKDNVTLNLSSEELKRFGNAIGISNFDVLDEETTRYHLKSISQVLQAVNRISSQTAMKHSLQT